MADIEQEFPIAAPPHRVYDGVSTPAGLDEWWTATASGVSEVDSELVLGFGPEYQWRAVVTKANAPYTFELRMIKADADWEGTIVGFELTPRGAGTSVRFYHTGWPAANEHYRISCHCWALYLRILRRYLEFGEKVPYDRRLDV